MGKRADWELNQAIKDKCDQAALTLFSLTGMGDWVRWIVYLLEKLEALDTKSEPSEFDDGLNYKWMLGALRETINARLDEGNW